MDRLGGAIADPHGHPVFDAGESILVRSRMGCLFLDGVVFARDRISHPIFYDHCSNPLPPGIVYVRGCVIDLAHRIPAIVFGLRVDHA